ncbi:hypothetical protein GJR96_00620 [Haloferax sp. MBLA0076]|uniref:Uncharacterized protein n=1 Tax=Haloferax litoreum TaxID=2666140 RepID=A0A6A8GD47_9EURY|nr:MULTISPECIES: hypothetical protein [Haloferax]KAB1192020.1 hypothetical protein Hfx1148_00620 [Haloferax sp. CBA1148]MRX20462.1 hypothetical protein [Haloferax litoreum]
MTRLKIRQKLYIVVTRLQRWLANNQFDDLREFVYLDEISVRSLLASTGEGGIVSETVNEEMRRRRSGSSAGGSVSAGASVNAKVSEESEHQRTTVETRNYDLIQSKFTRLYKSDVVEKKLSLDRIPKEDESVDDPFSGLATSELTRGDVAELRVNISANLLFRLYRTIDYFADAFEDQIDSDTEEMLELIGSSLGNRIPVVGKAVDYEVVDEGDGQTIKRSTEIDDDEEAQGLEVVTLLNLDSLWVDPIQTLFNNDRFVIYCRVEDVDIDRWYPLKVTRAINSLSEPAAENLNREFERGLQDVRNQLSEIQNFTDWSTDSAARWSRDIQQYTESLEEEYDQDVSDDEQEQLIVEALGTVDIGEEVSQTAKRKRILNAYTDAFIKMFDLNPIGDEKRQQLRSDASATGGAGDQEDASDESSNVFRIEAKTVAMYW